MSRSSSPLGIVSGGLAVLMVFQDCSRPTAAASAASTEAAKATKTARQTEGGRGHLLHGKRPQVHLAAVAPPNQRAKRAADVPPDGASSQNESMSITGHTKKVKRHKPTVRVAPVSTKKLKNGTASPATALPLDAQFAGLDENNDDLDPLNVGDGYRPTPTAPWVRTTTARSWAAATAFRQSQRRPGGGRLLLASSTAPASDRRAERPDDNGYYEPHILYDSSPTLDR